MTDISILAENINNIGFKASIIKKKNWSYSDINHSFEPNRIFIFSTEDVGYGDFGLSYPDEIKKDKWQNAYGIIRCINYKGASNSEISVSFSVIPKISFNNIKIISAFLKTEQECSICNKISKHVKIDTEIGLVYCLDCYSNIPRYCVATFSL